MEAAANVSTEEELIAWCKNAESNGISQHSLEWLAAKKFTIGGSSIATIMGLSSFQTMRELLLTRLGVRQFNSDIKPQWGNMLEEVIKREVEYMFKCTVHGEDLYLPGHIYGTSYSPDGLGIVDGKLVLFEFKCPYSRIPSRDPPKYYVPQVKMGLELIPHAEYGIYAEAVYRRCTWEQLGPSGDFDTTLVEKPSKPITPISYGFVGFYTTDGIAAATRDDIANGRYKYPAPPKPRWQARNDTAEIASYDDDDLASASATAAAKAAASDASTASSNPLQIPGFCEEYGEFVSQSNDLSESSPNLMRALMHALDTGRIRAWYSETIRERDPSRANAAINRELAKYHSFIAGDDIHGNGCTSYINYGILPWKLLRIAHHRIEREQGYLDPWKENITKIIDFVKSIHDDNVPHWEIPQRVEDFMADYEGTSVVEYGDD